MEGGACRLVPDVPQDGTYYCFMLLGLVVTIVRHRAQPLKSEETVPVLRLRVLCMCLHPRTGTNPGYTVEPKKKAPVPERTSLNSLESQYFMRSELEVTGMRLIWESTPSRWGRNSRVGVLGSVSRLVLGEPSSFPPRFLLI